MQMNWLAPRTQPEPKIQTGIAVADTRNLEQILEELCQYGKPWLSKHNNGWHAAIDIFVSGTGVKFEVKTEFDCPTARAAAATCSDRLTAALRSIGK
jgi:hypothetical protein